MRFASVAEVNSGISTYLDQVCERKESLVITLDGKPHVHIQPIREEDFEHLEWKGLADQRLTQAWEGEEDKIYDYL